MESPTKPPAAGKAAGIPTPKEHAAFAWDAAALLIRVHEPRTCVAGACDVFVRFVVSR